MLTENGFILLLQKKPVFIPSPSIRSSPLIVSFIERGLGTSYSESVRTSTLTDLYAKSRYLLRFCQRNYLDFHYLSALGASAMEGLDPWGWNNDHSLNSTAPAVLVPASPHCPLPAYPVPTCISGRTGPSLLAHIHSWDAPTYSCSSTHSFPTSRTHMSLV